MERKKQTTTVAKKRARKKKLFKSVGIRLICWVAAKDAWKKSIPLPILLDYTFSHELSFAYMVKLKKNTKDISKTYSRKSGISKF